MIKSLKILARDAPERITLLTLTRQSQSDLEEQDVILSRKIVHVRSDSNALTKDVVANRYVGLVFHLSLIFRSESDDEV